MSDEFDADKMLEELYKLEKDETSTSPNLEVNQFNYEIPDGTIIDTNCNCSGGGLDTSDLDADAVCSAQGECVRSFNIRVENMTKKTIIYDEVIKFSLPGCHSCLVSETSSGVVVKKDSMWCVELVLCTEEGCTETHELPMSLIGTPTTETQFNVNVELLPMDSDEVMASAEREALDVNVVDFPPDVDITSASYGFILTNQECDELGLE